MGTRLLIDKSGHTIIVRQPGDFSTKHGVIRAKAMKKTGKVKSSKGVECLVMDALLRDRIQSMRMGARPVYEYDAGVIAALLSLEREFEVLEAGTGSGGTALYFSNIVKKVYTFEREERFYEVAKKNFVGVKNIMLENKDFLKARFSKKVDAVFLDMQNPVPAMKKAHKNLRSGHFMGVFTPIIDDIKPVMKAMKELGMVQVQGVVLDLKELEIKKYARVKGLFGFPGFFIVGRKF